MNEVGEQIPPQQAPAPQQSPIPEQAPEDGMPEQGAPEEEPENGDDQEIIDAISSLGLKDKEAVLSYAESLKSEHEDAPDESSVAVDALGEGKTYTKLQIKELYSKSKK